MTDRKDQLLETQDEPMQSTGSSGASLSFEHLDPGLLRAAANPVSSQPSTIGTLDMNFLDTFLIAGGKETPVEPSLEIIEQPKPKDLRFRYECEGRSAGSLLGVKSSNDRKTYPTVKIKNYKGKAKIVASLVTRQTPHQLHPNGLVGKLCKNGICTVMVENNQKMTVSFPNLGIQCAKKKDIHAALQERLRLGVNPFNQSAATAATAQVPSNDFEMNVVCLCFQAFLPDPERPKEFTRALLPQVSVPVYDKKGASLNISRVDRNNGTVEGGDEMFILCDKVQKDDIEVVFFLDDWEANATFGPSDIHRQVAIVCRTPPYRDKNIQQTVNVQFKLRRKSDQETSDPVEFMFKPIDLDADGVEAKRRKKSPHFEMFFKAANPVKQEPVDQVLPCGSMMMAPQQPQQLASSHIASASGNVKQLLRNRIVEQNSKQSNVQVFSTDPSLDIRQPPRQILHAVRSAPNHQRMATFSKASSTFTYSHGSNMSFGTVTQRKPPATATTSSPFTLSQAPLTNSGAPESGGMPTGYQPQPANAVDNLATSSDFGTDAAMQGYTTSNTNAVLFATNSDETLIQQISDNVGDLLADENFLALMDEENIAIDDLPSVSMEELTTLENFNPRALSIRTDMPDGMVTEQGSCEYALENVNDSVSIPYSHSVELEHEPPIINQNANCDQNG